MHPDFLDGPELVTPPVVYNAGLLRAIGRYIDTTAWAWLSAAAGQQLFYPPNVSRLGLHALAGHLHRQGALGNGQLRDRRRATPTRGPAKANRATAKPRNRRRRSRARSATGPTRALAQNRTSCLADFAKTCLEGVANASGSSSPYRAIRQNALRMLIATSPDMQVS